jgi:hypothetical protein
MSKALPPNPHIDWLRKAAKVQLAALRRHDASAKLHQAQLAVANDYGFASWRALKASSDSKRNGNGAIPPISPASAAIRSSCSCRRARKMRRALGSPSSCRTSTPSTTPTRRAARSFASPRPTTRGGIREMTVEDLDGHRMRMGGDGGGENRTDD